MHKANRILLRRDGERRARFDRTMSRASELLMLRVGWYFGKGEPISLVAFSQASTLLRLAYAAGLWKSSIAPRVEGGVQIVFVQADFELEIAVEADGTADIQVEKGGDVQEDQEGLSANETADRLRFWADVVCSLERFTPTISTGKTTASSQPHLNRPATAAFPDLTRIVQSGQVGLSASIFKGTTSPTMFHPTREYFGASIRPAFPKLTAGTKRPRAMMTHAT